jgi:hypothetical protein
MPLSEILTPRKLTHGVVSAIEHCGQLDGGSLAYSHQQICCSDVMPSFFIMTGIFPALSGKLFQPPPAVW